MVAYLIEYPPVRDQWYRERNRPLTGCTVLHSAESVMDTVGPDTGAEVVAEFIRTRTSPGSYHDLCDSDSALQLVEYRHGAYHDGTGSNNWALSISWALRTTDWAQMTPERRRSFLRQGARAFIRQQEYRRSIGAPLTEPRRITKAESDAGVSGFIAHGDRDPGRRSDPGTMPPNLFPWAEWWAVLQEETGGGTPPPDVPEEDEDMAKLFRNAKGTVVLVSATWAEWVPTAQDHRAAVAQYGPHQTYTDAFFDAVIRRARAAGTPPTQAVRAAGILQESGADPDDPATWPPTPEDDGE